MSTNKIGTKMSAAELRVIINNGNKSECCKAFGLAMMSSKKKSWELQRDKALVWIENLNELIDNEPDFKELKTEADELAMLEKLARKHPKKALGAATAAMSQEKND